jgi:flavin-dependent dehydrogenase
MYDIIVVGARCAGSPLAILMARKGYRVLLVDRATFPSDTMSTHIVWPSGLAKLKRWGLLERVLASNCPVLTRMSFDVGPFALSGSVAADGVSMVLCPRRTVLDKILVDAAAEAGAEVRTGFSVQEIIFKDGRVTGIRGRQSRGAEFVEEGRIVAGADGLHSLVARAVQAPEYNSRPALACAYYTYWSGLPHDRVTVYARDWQAAGIIPTNDGLTLVLAGLPNQEFQRYRANIEGTYMKILKSMGDLAERVRGGKREERYVGTADVPNFFRKPYGPGWVLLGDAGYHKDPYTAQGISDAFRDAELLAGALDDGLGRRRPLEDALASYEQTRHEEVMPMYDLTCQLAALAPPPPEMQQLFGALQGNQADTNSFLGVMAGGTRVSDFFAPENVRRIVAGAQQKAAQA